MGIYKNSFKINTKQSSIIDKIFYKGRIKNLFWIVACQKRIYFNNEDIEKYGEEILDAMYMEGMLEYEVIQ